MELTIKAKGTSVGHVYRCFASVRGRLAQRGQGVVRGPSSAVRASDEVWARRRREQEAFGAIGLAGKGLF
jgi:hypothetical protein